MNTKQRKFAYLSKDSISKIEKVKEKYATTFSGALNIILTTQKN